jgi:hypothetical protein
MRNVTDSCRSLLLDDWQGGRSSELCVHVQGFLDHRTRIEAHWRSVSPDNIVAHKVRTSSFEISRRMTMPHLAASVLTH